MADNLSNVPPIVTLSGIPGVGGSFSGAGQGGLSGTGGTGGGGLFGMEAGPDLLAQLAALGQGGAEGTSAAAGLGLGQSLGAPSFGQIPGGLGAGNFSQGFSQGQGTVAGQTAAGGAGGSVGQNTDPLSILSKVLGIGSKVAGLVGNQGGQAATSSPTQSGQEQGAFNAYTNAPAGTVAGNAAGNATFGDSVTNAALGSIAGGGTAAGGAGALDGLQGGVSGIFPGQTTPLPFGDVSAQIAQTLGIDPSAFAGFSSNDLTEIANAIANVGAGETGQILGLGETGAGFMTPEQLSAIQGLGGGLSGSGAAGGAGGLGSASALGNLVGPVLGLIAQLSGNQDLATAAKAAGVGGNVLSLISSLSNLSSLAPLLGTTTAAIPTGIASGLGSGAATGAAAGGSAGLGTAAGAAALPIAVMSLFWGIGNMISPGSYPDLSDIWTGGKVPDYLTFANRLMKEESQQGKALGTLRQALPYVQNQAELGQLLNTYKNYLGTTTGIPLEDKSGTGDPYTLTTIPGTGPITHGMKTPTIDWGPQTAALQNIVNSLSGVLPGERITAAYGEPGGSLQGDAAMRLWTQFLDRQQNAPLYSQGAPASGGYQVGEGVVGASPAVAPGFYAPEALPGISGDAFLNALRYGMEGYDYAGSGFPEPGKYFGQVSPYWQALMQLPALPPQGQA